MAKAQVRYGQLIEQEDKILIGAYQTGAFRKELESQLRTGFGRNRKSIAESYVKEAVAGIKSIIRAGIDGATARVPTNPNSYTPGTRSGTVSFSGQRIGNVSYRYRWDDLAHSTVRRKTARAGRGQFWRDRGLAGGDYRRDPLSVVVNSLRPPKITLRTVELDLESRRASKKDPDKIDFTVNLQFGQMDSPFDEMIRRPLVTGDRSVEIPDVDESNKFAVFVWQEFGVAPFSLADGEHSGIPARPWIVDISAKIGEQMFDALITET